jgi:hypothetical protein
VAEAVLVIAMNEEVGLAEKQQPQQGEEEEEQQQPEQPQHEEVEQQPEQSQAGEAPAKDVTPPDEISDQV